MSITLKNIFEIAYPPSGVALPPQCPWEALDVAEEQLLCLAYYRLAPAAEKHQIISHCAYARYFQSELFTLNEQKGLEVLKESALEYIKPTMRALYESSIR
jgi:hypothetical protein